MELQSPEGNPAFAVEYSQNRRKLSRVSGNDLFRGIPDGCDKDCGYVIATAAVFYVRATDVEIILVIGRILR
jgi:hypothetical protein